VIRINKKLVSALLVLGIMGFSNLTLAETRDLTEDEIVTMFSDKTAWGKHAKTDKSNKVYFAPDGTYKSKRLDKSGGSEGTWSVDGSDLCVKKNGDTRCRKVVDKNGNIIKYKGKKHVWTYTKFEDGNQL